MNKAGKIILYSGLGILALGGMLVITFGYEMAQIGSDPDNFIQMTEMITATAGVCPSTDTACKSQVLVADLRCFSPLLDKDERLGCFHKAVAETNKKFHPELAISNHSPEQISYWVKNAVGNIFSGDYKDPKAKSFIPFVHYFTPEGFVRFVLDKDGAGIFQTMKDKNLAVILVADDEPKIKQAYVSDNVYTWDVEYPVTLRFRPADIVNSNDIPAPVKTVLFLKIARSDLGLGGVGISQWAEHANRGN